MQSPANIYFPPFNYSALAKNFLPPVLPDPSDPEIATTYLGTPVYSNLVFLADPDTRENKDLVFNSVLLTVDQEPLIAETVITGRRGRVREYINLDDYGIFIEGVINSPYPLVFPKEELTAFKNLIELPKALEVASSYLQIFSIHSIVVKRVRFAEMAGTRNQVAFQMFASSDEPIDLNDIQ